MKSDAQLENEVMQELLFEPAVTSSDIHVAASDGVVRLGGRVLRYADKWAAERTTQRVEGVKAIIEEIEVISTRPHNLNDLKIAEAVVNAKS